MRDRERQRQRDRETERDRGRAKLRHRYRDRDTNIEAQRQRHKHRSTETERRRHADCDEECRQGVHNQPVWGRGRAAQRGRNIAFTCEIVYLATTRLTASPDLHAVVLPVKRAIARLQQSG